MEKIDFVIIWVDGNDPKWQKKIYEYHPNINTDTGEIRYRDWGLLKFWFRGVENFASWVNNVYFVTCGHYPDWLNFNNPKLKFIRHSDYIPSEYLPTFNSHTIELNLHRIEGLSERFVYFNDDFFLIDNVNPDFYFKKNLPCDMPIIRTLTGENSLMSYIELSNIEVLNRNFNKKDVLEKNLLKWFNLKYRHYLFQNLYFSFLPQFTGFYTHHSPAPFLKSTFHEIWHKEYETLDRTCKCRFREKVNVNQYLIRYWQLASGQFVPFNNIKKRLYYALGISPIDEIVSSIVNQKSNCIILNDSILDDFETTKLRLLKAFNKILPNKSSFEI